MGYLENFDYQIKGISGGPKLVFLHGLMGSGRNWQAVANAFLQEYQVLTFDQRGHGRSFQPESGYDPEDYAKDLLQILDELGWQKVVLVGHSMGGRNAISFASKFSHRVIGLVVEDIGPSSHPEGVSRITGLLNMVPTPFASRSEAREFFQNQFPAQLGNDGRARTLANYFYMNIAEQADGSAQWRFSKKAVLASLLAGRKQDRWQEFSSLSIPTLVVRGAISEDLNQETFDKMLAVNPNTRGVVVPDAGHWVHFDQPQAFIDVLKTFFSELPVLG